MSDETSKKKSTTKRKNPKGTRVNYQTHNGHPLTTKEAIFIDKYIELGNQKQAVLAAGYTTSAPGQYGQTLLDKAYIAEEIKYQLEKLEGESIASATEILQYFTGVMRGEVADQFGLEAPLSERTKAAQELAKRQIDMVNRVNGVDGTNEVKIVLDWGE